MKTARIVILSVGIIILLGGIGYTIGMVFLAQSIRKEHKIDVDRLEKDVTREQCDLINGTILAINYDCSHLNCDCTECHVPDVIGIDKYKCFTVTIEYRAAYGVVPIETCLSDNRLAEFTINKDASDSERFIVGLTVGIAAWLMVASVYLIIVWPCMPRRDLRVADSKGHIVPSQ